jgi:hypothetical protein
MLSYCQNWHAFLIKLDRFILTLLIMERTSLLWAGRSSCDLDTVIVIASLCLYYNVCLFGEVTFVRRHDIRQNDTLKKMAKLINTLSIKLAMLRYSICTVTQSNSSIVIMLSVFVRHAIMLSIMILTAIILCGIML